jgi:hypothetical protein
MNDNYSGYHSPSYPQTLKAGDIKTVVCGPETLQLEAVGQMPLKIYHKKRVTVVATKERTTYPDDEGLVDCLLPFPYYQGEKAVHMMAIPCWCLV